MWHAGEANAPTPLSGASARVRIGRADEKLSHQKSAANPAFAFTPGGSRLPPGYFELSKIIRLSPASLRRFVRRMDTNKQLRPMG